MKSFPNITSFVAYMATRVAALPAAEVAGLEMAAKLVADEARAEVGHYQGAAGPFRAWPELADVTKADRVAKGFSANDPLLRTGELRDSIGHSVDGRHAVVGSKSDVAVFQEMGTSKIPPRSFLGHAAVVKGPEAAKAVGLAVAHTLAGKRP